MRVLIVEDELPAARQLQRLIGELDAGLEFAGHTQSVVQTVQWLQEHEPPGLIFMDIQLSDDLSFAIFELTEVKSPVIFTTAYDEYALQAFKVNSIDYLLKPVEKEELEKAIKKLESLKDFSRQIYPADLTAGLAQAVLNRQPVFKNRFLVRRGEQFLSIPAEEIRYFVSEYKVTYCITREQLKFSIENTLEELEKLLDPKQFFRINRQCIVHFNAIEKIHNHFNGKLLIVLKTRFESDFSVSREKAAAFKAWLDS